MSALGIGLVIAAAVAVLVALPFVAARFMGGLFRRGSGYARLAARYPAGTAPAAALSRQSIRVGAVRYMYCCDAAAMPQGLYLHVRARFVGPHEALLLPWEAVTTVRPVRIKMLPAVELGVAGDPPARVAVLRRVYDEARPFLHARGLPAV